MNTPKRGSAHEEHVTHISTQPCGEVTVRGQTVPLFLAEVTQLLEPSGVAVLRDGSNNRYTVKYTAIPGYRGEHTSTMGFGVGSIVRFAQRSNEVIYLDFRSP